MYQERFMRRFLIVGLLCIAFAQGAGPGKFVAVLETVSDGTTSLTASELHHLTDKLRAIAVQTLPAEMGFTIMTRENIQAMLPPGKALEECVGSCLVETAKNIAADYVAQGRVGRFGKDLTLTVELYETQGSKLMGSISVESLDARGLLGSIEKESPGLFGRIRGSGWLPASVQSASGVVVPLSADEVGTVVTVAFTDGPGAVLIDGKMACT